VPGANPPKLDWTTDECDVLVLDADEPMVDLWRQQWRAAASALIPESVR
jgi:hypothetical protein